MIKFISLLTLVLTLTIPGLGKTHFNSLTELTTQIKACKTDFELNQFLIKNDFVSTQLKKEDVGYDEENPDTILFNVDSLKIDVFRKNLFGNTRNEIVIQLRQYGVYYINVFEINASNEITKVPGFIANYFTDQFAMNEQAFSFYFENIRSSDQFVIIARSESSYIRSNSSGVIIWQVVPDEIIEVYNFLAQSSTYSGLMIYSYSMDQPYKFVLQSSYPKKLILNKTIDNAADMLYSEDMGSDTLAGTMEQATSKTIVLFKLVGQYLKVAELITKTTSNTREIRNTTE